VRAARERLRAFWLISAKKEKTQLKRLATLMEASERGEPIVPLKRPASRSELQSPALARQGSSVNCFWHRYTLLDRRSRFRYTFLMAHRSTTEKQQAHELIERLPATQLSAVVGLLEAMLDPFSRALANAPIDDEPVTPEEEKALAEAREWLKRNKAIPHEQVLAEVGITQEEINNFKFEEPK